MSPRCFMGQDHLAPRPPDQQDLAHRSPPANRAGSPGRRGLEKSSGSHRRAPEQPGGPQGPRLQGRCRRVLAPLRSLPSLTTNINHQARPSSQCGPGTSPWEQTGPAEGPVTRSRPPSSLCTVQGLEGIFWGHERVPFPSVWAQSPQTLRQRRGTGGVPRLRSRCVTGTERAGSPRERMSTGRSADSRQDRPLRRASPAPSPPEAQQGERHISQPAETLLDPDAQLCDWQLTGLCLRCLTSLFPSGTKLGHLRDLDTLARQQKTLTITIHCQPTSWQF